MPGLVVFNSVADALREGFHIYTVTQEGYLVRRRGERGWAMAIVRCKHRP